MPHAPENRNAATPAPGPTTEGYREVRDTTRALAAGLSDADATVQSMPDASPAKWHLGHTTWFFEAVVLCPHADGYVPFDKAFHFLFNSYYEALGPRQPRPLRGMLTRPDLKTVQAYRDHVDGAMEALLESGEASEEVLELVELGLHHEQQHQELLLTDILHLFAQNPLHPEYKAPEPLAVEPAPPASAQWIGHPGGTWKIGHAGDGFAFDCESPRHDALVRPFELASRPVTNAEWLQFMAGGGYADPLLWLSDGWATVQENAWAAPLYWEERDGEWWTMTLRGFQPVDAAAPVTHVSYYEADAYARWSGARLPTEFEWETVACDQPIAGNFAHTGRLRPAPAPAEGAGHTQMFGDVWEWTASPYVAYPGFKPLQGAAEEYNGKFMSGQFVLRGGSCATPAGHVRATYRNFFYPHQRWQFTGLRLARDAD